LVVIVVAVEKRFLSGNLNNKCIGIKTHTILNGKADYRCKNATITPQIKTSRILESRRVSLAF
jgi:hypothetical protein